jgi:hypothetical protein
MAISEEDMDIDEARSFARKRVGAAVDRLTLVNAAGRSVDEVELGERLAGLPGIERIETLEIGHGSRVRDLRFLAPLPRVRSLLVHGGALERLDGIEGFRGDGVTIDTRPHRGRDLARLAETRIRELLLVWARQDDLAAVARCRTLRVLLLRDAPLSELSALARVPLEQLSLTACKGETLDLGPFARLGELQLGCRKLARLTGTSRADWVLVDRCNALDLTTLRCLPRLRNLMVIGRTQPVPLSVFRGHTQLESILLGNSPVELDRVDLGLPKLEKLSANRLRRDQAEALSKANPGLVVSDGKHEYWRGARRPTS